MAAAAAAAAAAAPVIFLDAAPICASFLLLTDPVMPTRAGICSPKVYYSPFQKTKKYSHSTCQLKGERNMYVKSTDGKLITLIQEWLQYVQLQYRVKRIHLIRLAGKVPG